METEDKYIIKGKSLERYIYRQDALKEFSKLFTYNKGDDRAIVIIGAAFIDTILEHILIEFLPEDEKEVNNLLNFDKPLGAYANKVRMIYCLGLIEKTVMQDLKLVGKIRNKFAHNLTVSFDDTDVKSWCRELKWHKRLGCQINNDDAPARDFYQVGVNTIISYLSAAVDIAKGQKRTIRSNF